MSDTAPSNENKPKLTNKGNLQNKTPLTRRIKRDRLDFYSLLISFTLLFISISIPLLTYFWLGRDALGRSLLAEALVIFASTEAWILDGPGYETAGLSTNLNLTETNSGGLWLRAVEVRTILDQSPWNATSTRFYAIIGKRRAWTVREHLKDGCSYDISTVRDVKEIQPHPALISSRAQTELTGWLEEVSGAARNFPIPTIGQRQIDMLKPILRPLSGEDRIALLPFLSEEAKAFLRDYRDKFPACK